MNLQYSRTLIIKQGVAGDVFTTPEKREIVFIRDGTTTTACVEPWIHWALRRVGLIDTRREWIV